MKATLEFNLDEIEDRVAHMRVIKIGRAHV